MPVDTIDQLEQDIVDIETGAEQSKIQGRRTLGQDLGQSMQGALKGAAVLQTNEINQQKQREVDELLKSGVAGITAYGKELGLKDNTLYENMARNVKDPKELINIYSLQKKKADTDAAAANRGAVLGTAVDSIKTLRDNPNATREDYMKLISDMGIAELNADKDTALQINRTKDDLAKEANQRFGDPEKVEAKASAASSKQRVRDEEKVSDAMETVVTGKRGGQRAFGVPIAKLSSIMDGLDTIAGVREGEFKGTKEIGQELASIIAQVLSVGGGTTEGDRRALAPESFAADTKGVIQYVTGNPQQAIQDGLLEQLEHMLDRERKFWKKTMNKKNNLLFHTIRPVFDRVDGGGRFVNKDLMRDWVNLLESSDALTDLSRDAVIVGDTGDAGGGDGNIGGEAPPIDVPIEEATAPAEDEQGFIDVGGGYSFKVVEE